MNLAEQISNEINKITFEKKIAKKHINGINKYF